MHIAILESGGRKQRHIFEEGTALTAERREHAILAAPSREEVGIGAMDVFSATSPPMPNSARLASQTPLKESKHTWPPELPT